MKRREAAAGIVLLAVLAAGAWWVRWPSPPPSAARGASAPAADEALPDATLAAATVDAGGVGITLSLSPNPPVAFAKTLVRVRAQCAGAVVPLEGARVSFEMTMPMGGHRYSLVAGQDGWQEAQVTLPRCMSGERRWYATVEGTVAGRPVKARFRFDLATPGS